jgi:REP element-mobilizing transposase RayT
MPLFQTSVLNKYLAEQDKPLLEQQYALYRSYFLNTTIQKNIIASKEEEFQEGFLRELFVKVLGYTINPEPDYNLKTELKNIKDGKKADGAIVDGEKVLAIIELKGTDTINLNQIEIQAFGYKNNQENCKYVITSNFQKLRFYIDNAIEFLEWDLFKLDFENFKLLYLCLGKENIFKNIAANIKVESVTVEENVTKRLYKEYSGFRKALFNNIAELNANTDKLLLFKKTQKLLDRFLFLFFAEDRMLVPPNSVRKILEQWNSLKDMDAYQPLYARFKLYFGYLNTGHKGKQHDIFAYNGGLFAPDDVLDNVIIDDNILYEATLSLSNYDYNSEIDVNILGHIFEHSLTEIEELESVLTNNGLKPIAETPEPVAEKSKRKKDGVFYTPKYITKYIVENTVGALCKNKKAELKIEEADYHPLQKKKALKLLLENLHTYRDWLLQVTIIDPACGSGAFLNQALEFLIAEHKFISELEANITGSSIVFDVENSILENNLFGVDINEESVEIAKLSLWLRTARKGRKLNSLNNNIKCGNSLIDDEAVAGDKAFIWEKEFPQVFKKRAKELYFVTFVTHNSRISERMVQFNSPYFIENLQPFILNAAERNYVAESINELIEKHSLEVISLNILPDHVHLIIAAADENDLDEKVRKLKGGTSFSLNRKLGIQKNENKVWAQKYHWKLIENDTMLSNIKEYIETNHYKHSETWGEALIHSYEGLSGGGHSDDGLPNNGLPNNGLPNNGLPNNGLPNNGLPNNGLPNNGLPNNGLPNNGLKPIVQEPLKPIVTKLLTDPQHIYNYNATINYSGFDVVIGNPPYVFTRGNNYFNSIKEFIWANYKYNQGKINLYSVFLEISLTKLLNKNGLLGFITPETFLRTSTYEEVRKYLYKNYNIINFEIYGIGVFENVTAEVITMIIQKTFDSANEIIFSKIEGGLSNEFFVLQSSFDNTPQSRFVYDKTSSDSSLFDKLKIDSLFLKLIVDTRNGVATKSGKNNFISKIKITEKYKKLLEAPEIYRYGYHWNGDYINYDKEALHRPRKEETFLSEKILIQRVSSKLICCYDENQFYTFNSINNLILINEEFQLKFLLVLLNSKLINYYYRKLFSFDAGFTITVTKENLDELPIKNVNKDTQQPFIEKADLMLTKNAALQEATKAFIKLLQAKFETININTKLEKWYNLSFTEFSKELSKQKIKLSLAQESEWLSFFEQEKQKALAIKNEIDTTDAAIDKMVYALYGLSEDEVKIVEGN